MPRMRSLFLLPGALAALLLSSPCGAEVKPERLTAKGEKGVYSIELTPPEEGLRMGVNSLEIILHDASGGNVTGAEITVTPWMPEHNHGVSEQPDVTDRGGGAYTVENILFIMTGWWELAFEVDKGGLSDKVIFNFPEVRTSVSETAVPATARTDLDLSATVQSERGMFTVGYESATAPIPLNSLHSWTITVKDQEGKPITGAAVTLVGDMPEHGHGLPTEPEMTEELEGGRYTIDGIRFSMPGWWVMTFHIRAGEAADNASFNLMLR